MFQKSWGSVEKVWEKLKTSWKRVKTSYGAKSEEDIVCFFTKNENKLNFSK